MRQNLIALLLRYRQFLTFCVIGVANTAIHSTIVILLVERYFLSPVIANISGFLISNVASFFLNSFFTFEAKISFSRYVRFLSASLFSLLIIVLISSICEFYRVYYLYSLALVLVASPLINFFFLKRFAFR